METTLSQSGNVTQDHVNETESYVARGWTIFGHNILVRYMLLMKRY
jgi:hypothetical protein